MSSVPPFMNAGHPVPGGPRSAMAPTTAPVREPFRVNPQTGLPATPLLDDPETAAMFESLVLGGYSPEEALALLQQMADGQMMPPFTAA